uniref:Uncharacterized protein n=1 Tax=Arundo donax TaxID=35708 RepID=A0A0A9B550_ARUDO
MLETEITDVIPWVSYPVSLVRPDVQ